MARSTEMVYDPKTGKWSSVTKDNKDDSNSGNKNNNTNNDNKDSNISSNSSDSDSSEGSVEKEYNDIEVNTLSGTLNFICTKTTIKLKAGDTVKIQGIGTHLSGKYYVKDVTRTISSNGYTHNATLIRTDFGTTLKTKTSQTNTKNNRKVEEVKKPAPKKQVQKVTSTPKPTTKPQRTYTVVRGDCLWNIAKKFYGSGAQYMKIFNANRNKLSNPNLIYVGQVLVIP